MILQRAFQLQLLGDTNLRSQNTDILRWMEKSMVLTSVISVKVCRPELSWIVLIATGIFTVSPSGIQKP